MKTYESLNREKPGIASSIVVYLILFVGFVIFLIWMCQIVLLDTFYENYTIRKINDTARALMDNINNPDLEALADRLGAENDVTVTLLDEDGDRLINVNHSRYSVVSVMNPVQLRELCMKAAADGTATLQYHRVQPFRNDRYNARHFVGSVPDNSSRNGTSLVYLQKISLADGASRYLVLNAQITPLDSTLSTLQYQLFFITTIVTLTAVMVAILISNRVAMPIIETSEAARGLSSGKFKRPERAGYREIEDLNDILVQAADDLSKLEKLQNELIANISHDLRTPLTMIEGYAEVMRDIPGENTPENVQIIIDETNRLSSLVAEVMDFSRLQSGTRKMNIAPFNLTEQIRSIVGRISRMTEKDGYVIRYEHDEQICVLGDETGIGQVIYNLIGNALTYTGNDRTVTITLAWADGKAHVAIHDTGKGIPEEEIPLIWKRYYRSAESHRRAVVGSGLGLSIVQNILEAHHTAYGVNSESGKGTSFWFELPIA